MARNDKALERLEQLTDQLMQKEGLSRPDAKAKATRQLREASGRMDWRRGRAKKSAKKKGYVARKKIGKVMRTPKRRGIK
jgi:hypothetical protein